MNRPLTIALPDNYFNLASKFVDVFEFVNNEVKITKAKPDSAWN